MTSERVQAHLQELEWIVYKGFQLRHHPFKQFPPSLIRDAITLIRMYRRLNRPENEGLSYGGFIY